jgi:hypothetical protein
VMTGNRVPDHATMARFICRHEPTLADLFGEVLELCDGAGLIKPGVVSIDGTRIAGNASPEVNHGFASVVGERKVEGAGVGVDMAEFAAVEHDCGGAPGVGWGAYASPCGDLVEHGCGGRDGVHGFVLRVRSVRECSSSTHTSGSSVWSRSTWPL